ncbi:MAG: hypothetical protein IT282_03945 [Bacteroidetes bacterium]|nr:hypothetical protein [Bacteroidota bacterium]
MKERKHAQCGGETLVDLILETVSGTKKAAQSDLAAFRNSPSPEMLDRVMAFRSHPMYDEFRSALERLERGAYGRCVMCKDPLGAETIARDPTARYCSRCLATVRGDIAESTGISQPSKHSDNL